MSPTSFSWLLLLMENDAAVGEVVNLGNPREISILDLAHKVIEVTGASVGIDFIPYNKAYEAGFEDMQRRVPDISKITALDRLYAKNLDGRVAAADLRLVPAAAAGGTEGTRSSCGRLARCALRYCTSPASC